jgi:hypothetical protein
MQYVDVQLLCNDTADYFGPILSKIGIVPSTILLSHLHPPPHPDRMQHSNALRSAFTTEHTGPTVTDKP